MFFGIRCEGLKSVGRGLVAAPFLAALWGVPALALAQDAEVLDAGSPGIADPGTPVSQSALVVELGLDGGVLSPLESAALERITELEELAVAAKIEAAVAKVQQEAAERDADAAQSANASAETAKLLKSGITVGMAVGVHVPFVSIKGTSLQSGELIGMPYVAFLPAYWGSSEANRDYCASEWGGGSETDATGAAISIVRQDAKDKFETIVSAINAGASDEEIVEWLVGKERGGPQGQARAEMSVKAAEGKLKKLELRLSTLFEKLGHGATASEVRAAHQEMHEARKELAAKKLEYSEVTRVDPKSAVVNQIRGWLANTENGDAQELAAKKNDIVLWLAEQNWNSNLRGSCFEKRIGIYLGKPLNHSVRARVSDGGIETRTFASLVSFGFTFTPNAYISALVGTTVGNVERQGEEGTPKDPSRVLRN